jgi:hypothetical protein
VRVVWLAAFSVTLLSARAPDFAHDIAPIIYSKCAACHYDGGPGPFPLTSYSEVRNHAHQIAEVTRSRFMPPWLPEHGYGEFSGSSGLANQRLNPSQTGFGLALTKEILLVSRSLQSTREDGVLGRQILSSKPRDRSQCLRTVKTCSGISFSSPRSRGLVI